MRGAGMVRLHAHEALLRGGRDRLLAGACRWTGGPLGMHGTALASAVCVGLFIAEAKADWFTMLSGAYGPIAFGVASLLIIWKFIVGPELAASRLMVDGMLKASENNRAASENYRATLISLERMSERVEHKLELLNMLTERLTRLDTQTSEFLRAARGGQE